MPYYGRWLLAVARILVEKHHIGLTELSERMAEVQERYAGGLEGKTLEAKPKSEGDGSQVKRNSHAEEADGKGDPQCYAGQGRHGRSSRSATRSWCANFRWSSTPAPRSTCAARRAKSRRSPMKAPPPRTRPGTVPRDPEWFYVVKFNMADLWYGYTGTADDVDLHRNSRTLAEAAK